MKSDITAEKIKAEARRMARIIPMLAEPGFDIWNRYQRMVTGMTNNARTVARRTTDAIALTRSGSDRKIFVVSGFVFCRNS